jgi:hypothetical protein
VEHDWQRHAYDKARAREVPTMGKPTLLLPAVLVTLTGCSSNPAPPVNDAPSSSSTPAATADAAHPAVASDWGFHTPAPQAVTSLRVEVVEVNDSMGQLVVDGHRTGQAWAEAHPPLVTATGDGRFLLYGPSAGPSASDWELHLWEPGRRRLTNFGDVARQEVPPHGAVFVRYREDGLRNVAGVYELARSEPRLVTIWEGSAGDRAQVLGAHGGFLVILRTSTSARSERLLLIDRERHVRETAVDLRGYEPYDPVVRQGARVLLARLVPSNLTTEPPSDPGTWDLGALDMASGTIRELGRAPGSWTPTGISRPAPPHILVAARHAPTMGSSDVCTTLVHPTTLALTTRCPKR